MSRSPECDEKWRYAVSRVHAFETRIKVLKYNCVWVVNVSRFTGLSDIRVVFMAFTSVVLKTQTSNWKHKDSYVCWSKLFKMPTQLKEHLGIYLISTLVSSVF